ncbi:DUF6894 family protein [Microvirga sp. GCM10011540]|uniref:DUF6894 family protein n=1 Tax=Microvirga sp. GCM10011540 TaxID=3317338 RepID=UPI00361B8D11
MTRFHFDIREGSRFVPDPGGEELESLEAAKCHAVDLAAQIARDLALRPTGHVVIIEVCNEHKQRVLTLTVSLTIERPNAETQPHTPWGA